MVHGGANNLVVCHAELVMPRSGIAWAKNWEVSWENGKVMGALLQSKQMDSAGQSPGQSEAGGRVATVRRLYVYLVALISFTAMLFAMNGLYDSLADAWLQGIALLTIGGMSFVRMGVARSAGMLVVAAPIFLLHWRLAQRRREEAEIRAAMRKFFLYMASAVALGFAVINGYELLSGVARLAFGEAPAASGLLPSDWLHLTAITATAWLFLAYWQRVLRSDGDFGNELGVAATWRRIFLALVGWSGIAMLIFGSALLISTILQVLLDLTTLPLESSWFAAQAGDGLTMLLIGGLVLRTSASNWQSLIDEHEDEARSGTRRLYLYVAVVAGAFATLVPLAAVLRELLLLLLGGSGGSLNILLDQMIDPISLIPAGLAVWVWHWRRLSADELRYGESGEGATVRRIYFYAVAATGLVLTWLGLIGVVQVLLDRLFTVDFAKFSELWREPLATGLSLLLVGAPVWALHWQAVQRVARQSTNDGAIERGSLPRRVYLYGVVLAGALLILFSLAQVAYRVFLYLLGDRTFALFSPEIAEELARSLIAALLWLVHVAAIRKDMQQGAIVEEDVEQRRRHLQERRARLEAELADVQQELAQLDQL